MAQCPTASFPFSPSPQNHQHVLKGAALEACPSLFFSSLNAFHFLPRWIKEKRSVEAYGTRLSVTKKLSLLLTQWDFTVEKFQYNFWTLYV